MKLMLFIAFCVLALILFLVDSIVCYRRGPPTLRSVLIGTGTGFALCAFMVLVYVRE